MFLIVPQAELLHRNGVTARTAGCNTRSEFDSLCIRALYVHRDSISG